MAKAEGEMDFTFEVALKRGTITPKQIWENKDVWMKDVEDSKKQYDSLEEDQQDAIGRMVKAALERMASRSSEWVREGISSDVAGGDYVDIHFRLLFTDIDREIERVSE